MSAAAIAPDLTPEPAPSRALLPGDAHKQRVQNSPQFRNGKFRNSIPTPMLVGASPLKITVEFVAKSSAHRRPPRPVPVAQVDLARLATPGDVRATWLGHSTTLLEVDGLRVLTDPVWGMRASPMSFAGPKRFHDVPIALDALPRLDAILLTHNHYDHACAESLRWLAKNSALPIITALGVGPMLESFGWAPERITELDWWQSTRLPGHEVTIVATPARHFSGRGVLDRNRTLWTSFSLIGPHHRLFFSGDSGPSPEFEKIGELLGPFDLTLFEVGAHHPAWGTVHLGPDEALRAHQQVRGKAFLPIHWCTFDLGLHPWVEPIARLAEVAPQQQIRLLTPRPGQTAAPGDAFDTAWWTG